MLIITWDTPSLGGFESISDTRYRKGSARKTRDAVWATLWRSFELANKLFYCWNKVVSAEANLFISGSYAARLMIAKMYAKLQGFRGLYRHVHGTCIGPE